MSTSHGILRTMCRFALGEMWWFNKRKPHQGARPVSLRMIGLNTVNLQRKIFIRGGFDFLLPIVGERFSVSIAPTPHPPPLLGSQCGCTACTVWVADPLRSYKTSWGKKGHLAGNSSLNSRRSILRTSHLISSLEKWWDQWGERHRSY